MIYKAKEHTVKAFRFENPRQPLPKWFELDIHEGRASYTASKTGSYITLYKDPKTPVRANFGDWIVRGKYGSLFHLTETEFKNAFEPLKAPVTDSGFKAVEGQFDKEEENE